MSGKSVDFKLNLTLDTKDSDKQFQAVAERMKGQLKAIATETNKTKYFTGLEQTIKEVDKQLDALRDKHGDSFDGLFGQLDTATKNQFDSIFNYAKQRIDDIQKEIGSLSGRKLNLSSILNEYNKYSKSVNDLVKNDEATKISGFDKLNKSTLKEYLKDFKELIRLESSFNNNVDKRGSLEHMQAYVELMKRASAIKLAYNNGELVGVDNIREAEIFLNRIKSSHFSDIFTPINTELKDIDGRISDIISNISGSISDDIASKFSGGLGNVSGLIDNIGNAAKSAKDEVRALADSIKDVFP